MIDERVSQDPLIRDVVKRSLEMWGEKRSDDDVSKGITSDYRRYIARKWFFIVMCTAAMFVAVGVSLTIGDYEIGFLETYEIIWAHMTGNVTDQLKDHIIFNLRLPRIEIGIIAGIGLAVAGVVMQSTLMNPLADSYTTGVSSGASLGATLAVVMGWCIGGATNQYGIVVNAFLFSLVPMAVIILMSKIKNSSPTVMIMGGIAIMYIFSAFTTLFTLMADSADVEYLYKWGVGSLGFASKDDLPIMAGIVLSGTVALMVLTKQLNVLAAGDESAKSLGVNADMMRRVCLILTAFIVAAVVSFTGTIGFVGLVAPHVIRLVVGPDNRYLLPASALFGAVILVCADVIGRTIISPSILQAGVVMSFLGGPLFLWLILRRKSSVWS
ncbi:MAG: iron ABC transporter permease [Candidatus Methanomethylophilaceae archaeon]|nr:iron ABC transporter permease [Candidatus Methanomethylophilaceae archaeon]